MSAPKNIQRDGTYADPSDASVAASTTTMAYAPRGNSDANVYYDYGFVQHDFQTKITNPNDDFGTMVSCVGLFMTPPHKDRHPYRVKINVLAIDGRESREDPTFSLIIGFAPADITGTDDFIALPIYIPFMSGEFDDLVVMEDIPSDHDHFGKPMYFGLAVHGETTDCTVFAHISVQNLGIKPPTMQNAIS